MNESSKNKLKVLDLFAGIGGFTLGFHLAGIETTMFCEIDKDAQKVLEKNFPGIPIHGDIRTLKYHVSQFDIICGGFPCQDISFAGKREGIINGERSSLWKEYARIIDEVKPKYVVIENVEYLRKNGLGVVLGDLSKMGFDAEWHDIPATTVGLPHQRERLFIIAHHRSLGLYAHSKQDRHVQTDQKREDTKVYPEGKKCITEPVEIRPLFSRRDFEIDKDTKAFRMSSVLSLRRVLDGVPQGLDERRRKTRIKQLGNSVVPYIAELIGRRIVETDVAK